MKAGWLMSVTSKATATPLCCIKSFVVEQGLAMATHNNKPLDKLILLGIYFVLLKFQIHHVAAVQPIERYVAEIQINSIADKASARQFGYKS